MRGNKRVGLIGNCLLYAFKTHGVHKTKADIAILLNTTEKVIREGKSIFLAIYDQQIMNKNMFKTTGCEDFIHTFALKLKLKPNIERFVVNFYKLVKEQTNITQKKQPQSIATGCIYIVVQVLGLDISIENVVRECKISKVTIKAVCKKLESKSPCILSLVYFNLFCLELYIDNKITIRKTCEIVKLLHKILVHEKALKTKMINNDIQYHHISAMAMYFVMNYNKIEFNKERFYECTHTKMKDLIRISKIIVYYRDSLYDEMLKGPIKIINQASERIGY